MNEELLPVLLIIIPLGAAFLTTLISTFSRKLARLLPLIGVLAMVFIAALLLKEVVENGDVTAKTGFDVWNDESTADSIPMGIHLVATPLGSLMALGMSVVASFVLISALSTKKDSSEPWYSMMVMMATAGAVGMVITGDLFNLFVFLEITSISGTVLAALPRGEGDKGLNWRGAVGYAIISAIASFLILAAIALIYGATSTLNMEQIAGRITGADPFLIGAALLLMLVGFGIEAEIFPLNGWAPDVYRGARWGASSIFSGVIGKAGLLALLRVVLMTLGPALDGQLVADILLWGGAVTFLVGEAAAFTSKDLYRIFGFSSIGMFGLMLMSFSLGADQGIWAGVFIVVGHMVLKPVLFSITGSLSDRDKDAPLSRLNGLISRSRTTAFLFAAAAIMLLGLPPSPIFWGKYFLITGIGIERQWLLLGVLLVGILLEAGYIGKLLYRALSGREATKKEDMPFFKWVAVTSLLLISALIGLAPSALEEVAEKVLEEFLKWGVV
ncbi:MAG: complex I subunit 5 family protein [Thermoplasmatota archaeon]